MSQSVDELREKGNSCVKEGNHAEAVLHYSSAIRTDPSNPALHSNRSLAFLKLQQYYLAHQDAKRAIELKPDWAKGYFRKGEVEYATFHFDKALTSYTKAFCLQKDDRSLMEAMKKAARELKKDQRAEKQIPWLGAGIGIVLGVLIVLADYLIANKSVLTHPILKVLLTIVISLLGYGFCKAYRYFVKNQRSALLQPPLDLSGEGNTEQEQEDEPAAKAENKESHKRFSKAQARHRFKKGKAN